MMMCVMGDEMMYDDVYCVCVMVLYDEMVFVYEFDVELMVMVDEVMVCDVMEDWTMMTRVVVEETTRVVEEMVVEMVEEMIEVVVEVGCKLVSKMKKVEFVVLVELFGVDATGIVVVF